MSKIIFVLTALIVLHSCSVPTYLENSIATPCFNETNKYQISAGYSNDNYIGQIAVNAYKGLSIIGNSSFSEKQNNSDISIGYSKNNLLFKNLLLEAFVGYGLGSNRNYFTKNRYDIVWGGRIITNYKIENDFYKGLLQTNLAYTFEDNIQICIYGRYSFLNFRKYLVEYSHATLPPSFSLNNTNLKANIWDLGVAFKYQISHFGLTLQASYTDNNFNSNRLPDDIYFQKRFPVFVGGAISFYWNSFKKKN